MQLKRRQNVTTVKSQVTGLVSVLSLAYEALAVEEVAVVVTAVVITVVATAAVTTVVASETEGVKANQYK